MTFVGKMLAIAVTLFSIVFMGFAVSVFAARTNWRQKYLDENATVQKVKKERDALSQRSADLTAAVKQESDAHKAEREGLHNELKTQRENYDKLLDSWKDDRLKVTEQTNRANLAVADLEERRKETDRLRELVRTLQGEKEKAMNEKFKAEQDLITRNSEFENAMARLKETEQRAGELDAVLKSYGLSAETAEAKANIKRNPPPVEGVVLKVDPQGKFVEISIGSDDGLRKEHRLQVYRVNPQGKFVGTIEIVEVDADQAVARILPEFRQGTIQKGDLVAARITASL
jgi:hypothetical protein